MSHSGTSRPSGDTTRPSGPRRRRSSAKMPGLRGMAPPTVGRSGDAPGISRGQELRDVAGPALRDHLLLLVEHDLLVHGPLDRRQHADRHGEVRGEEVRQELCGIHVGLVVDPERARCHVLRPDGLWLDAVHDDGAPVVRRPEEQRLAVLEPELVLELLLLVVHHVPCEVVVDVAWNVMYDKERSEEHTSELQSRPHLVCRLLLEKKKKRHYEACSFLMSSKFYLM